MHIARTLSLDDLTLEQIEHGEIRTEANVLFEAAYASIARELHVGDEETFRGARDHVLMDALLDILDQPESAVQNGNIFMLSRSSHKLLREALENGIRSYVGRRIDQMPQLEEVGIHTYLGLPEACFTYARSPDGGRHVSFFRKVRKFLFP